MLGPSCFDSYCQPTPLNHGMHLSVVSLILASKQDRQIQRRTFVCPSLPLFLSAPLFCSCLLSFCYKLFLSYLCPCKSLHIGEFYFPLLYQWSTLRINIIAGHSVIMPRIIIIAGHSVRMPRIIIIAGHSVVMPKINIIAGHSVIMPLSTIPCLVFIWKRCFFVRTFRHRQCVCVCVSQHHSITKWQTRLFSYLVEGVCHSIIASPKGKHDYLVEGVCHSIIASPKGKQDYLVEGVCVTAS